MSSLKSELALTAQPASSLTSLLRWFECRACKQLNASHFQSLILSHDYAFFYQFSSSYIYNFRYTGTLIEEVLDSQSIVEVTSKDAEGGPWFDSELQEQGLISRRVAGDVYMLTGDQELGYKQIVYYPVVCDGRIKAVFEVGYAHAVADVVGDTIKNLLV